MPDQLMAKNLDTGEFCRADLLAVSWGDFSCGGGKGGWGKSIGHVTWQPLLGLLSWYAVVWSSLDCFTSHVGEHRTVRGLWKRQGIPCFFKIPTVQQSQKEEMLSVYVTLAMLDTLATAQYSPCLFGYVIIRLACHNQMHVNQSERLLVKPKRQCTDLCAEPVGVWNRLGQVTATHLKIGPSNGHQGDHNALFPKSLV